MDAILGFFAGLGAFFVLGSLSFWVVLATTFGLLIWFTESHNDFMATVFLVGFVILAAVGNDWSFVADPWVWVKYGAAYMVIGALYSFLKWTSFLFKRRDELKELKAGFITHYNSRRERAVGAEPIALSNGKLPPDRFADFVEYIRERSTTFSRYAIKTPADLIPTVQNNVASLTRWIVWWPFSAFWTFLNDPLTRLARMFIQMFRGFYDKIARGVFANEI